MKTTQKRLDEIGGIDLNSLQKLALKGGEEYPGGGTCAFMDPEGWVHCNLSQAGAEFMYAPYGPGSGARWCCDSCSETWWWQEGCGGGEPQ